MDKIKNKVVLAGLLHDVGKLVYRAERLPKNHSQLGEAFLHRYMEDGDILRAVKYHHKDALSKAGLSEEDISYIVYEADNIASGTDRRSNESEAQGFNMAAPLESVFNVFGQAEGQKTGYYLRGLLEKDEQLLYPVELSLLKADESQYKALEQVLESNFQRKAPDKMTPGELLQILEAVMSYMPSSTARGEAADISLYDHQKLTGALGACLYDYFAAHGITDYKAYCYGSKLEECRNTNTYLLASADMSGIQKFIYTIPSKGALKSLRGRSFYMELLLENVADELLEALELSRCNLLYTGGGNFYMLLPNTPKAKEVLERGQEKVNTWLLEHFGTGLYMALGWAECSAKDFMAGSENRLGEVYSKARAQIARGKHRRYSQSQLEYLFTPDSWVNKTRDGDRECSICHTSTAELFPYGGNADTHACSICNGLRGLGEDLLKYDVLLVLDKPMADKGAEAVELPALNGRKYLLAVSQEQAEQYGAALRIYVKNIMYTGQQVATRLWMGDYITMDGSHTMELEELAKMSGGSRTAQSIDRLGVLRADVDNLGAAFMAGLPAQYATLGRSAALSRQLSLFFKRYINNICAGQINGLHEAEYAKFSLMGREKELARRVHIIYSGGDDLFIVGAWDDLLELAVDIRRAFRRFTNAKLSFSAGLGMFDSKCPMAEMARGAGLLEDAAKSMPGKDSIALFGIPAPESHKTYSEKAYGWAAFTDKVCGEKLAFCHKYLGYAGNEAANKVPAGKGLLYRLLELLNDSEDSINLARFAYMMARMEPNRQAPSYEAYQQIRVQLYKWYQGAEDRKQLMTALELIIYSIRDKGE